MDKLDLSNGSFPYPNTPPTSPRTMNTTISRTTQDRPIMPYHLQQDYLDNTSNHNIQMDILAVHLGVQLNFFINMHTLLK